MRGVGGYKQGTSNLVERKFICSARANSQTSLVLQRYISCLFLNVQTNSKQLLAVPIAIGALVFFSAALVVAWHARQHQILGTQMPNRKGGHMRPGDGYFLALSLLCMAAGWCFGVARLIRAGRRSP